MKKNKLIGVGVSLLLMGTVVFGSLKLDSVAFADKVSNTKSSIEANIKDKKSIFSFNKEGKIMISTSASIKEIVDELVRIKKDSKLDIDLDQLVKDRDELLSSKNLTPSELADRVEGIFDEIEDIVEELEDEIEDLKDGKKDKKEENISQQSKKEFVKEKEKIKEKYSEKRKALKEKLREEISKGKDSEKAKREFAEGIKILGVEQSKEMKELKIKYFEQSKGEEKYTNKNKDKRNYKSYDYNDEEDDD